MDKEKKLLAEIARLKAELKSLRAGKVSDSSIETVKAPEKFGKEFEKAQKTVGKYFNKISIIPERGTIKIHNQRYVLVRASSLSYEFLHAIRNLYADRGDEEAMLIGRNFLFDIAHVIGIEDAKNFHKKMNLTDPISKLAAGPVHFAYTGWAFVDILPESHPTPNTRFFLKYHHPYSFEADSWLRNKKKTDRPVCIMNAGYSSGWCEASFGLPLTSVEISCRARGDAHCTFIMAPPDNIEQYLEKELLEKEGGHISVPSFFQRKKVEEQLKSSLEEKDMLLKEIHHRVKNNLQIVSSLLNLQSHQISDMKLKDQFTQSINRIKSMALIHEMLYKAKSFNKIDIHTYFKRLIDSLSESLISKEKNIRIISDIEDIKMNIDKAIPCGLIINELISNAIKYAFPNHAGGTIQLILNTNASTEKYQYKLIVADDGIGIPKDIDLYNTSTLGMQLINTLTEQIEGKMRYVHTNGAHFEISF